MNCAVPPVAVISVGPLTRTAVTVAAVPVVVVGVGEVTVTVRDSLPPPQPTASSETAMPIAPIIPIRPCIPLRMIPNSEPGHPA